MRLSLVLLLICSSATIFHAHADVFRWTDKHGKVHFGDRPPDKEKAEDISAQIEQQNVDESSATTRKLLEQHDRREAALETEQRQLSSRAEGKGEQRREACAEARRRLRILEGRVIFYDDAGHEIKVTEKERESRAARVKQLIAQRCD